MFNNIKKLAGINALFNNGAELYLVGGIVRDHFLNRESKDIDILVSKIPYDDLIKILSPFGTVIPMGSAFGIIQYTEGDTVIEFAIPRTEKKIGAGYTGFKIESDPLLPIEIDLYRRDCTINSIAYNLHTNELIDPYNGLNDLKNGIIRATSLQAFSEDPLRILRAIQFASRFNFKIHPDTWELILNYQLHIDEISRERIITELNKIYKGNRFYGFSLLQKLNIIQILSNDQFEIKIPSFINDKNLNIIDFYYTLLRKSIKPSITFTNLIKNDTNEKKIRQGILMLEVFNSKWNLNLSKFEKRILIRDLNNISNDCFNSLIIRTHLSDEINEILTGKMPLNKSKIAVNGNDLKLKGLKGAEIGDELERLFMLILNDEKLNIKDELLK